MEKRLRIFANFKEAGEADARRDAEMTPDERLKIVIDLRDLRHPDAAEQGFARVSRIIKLEQS